MPFEVIDYGVDNRNALKALAEINQGFATSEKGATNAGQRFNAAFQTISDVLLKISDKSVKANERAINSWEKYVSTINKTPFEKQLYDLDKLIAKQGTEEQSLKRLLAVREQIIAAEKKRTGEGGGFDFKAFGAGLEQFVANPMQGAGSAATGLLEKLGPVGIGLAGVGVAAVAVAGGVYEAAKSLGEFGVRMNDVQLRTGLSAHQLGLFDFAAKAAGTDISFAERAMKGLTVAIEDTTSKGEAGRAWLQKWGVDLAAVRSGNADTYDTLMKVSAGLEKLAPGGERNKAALDLFKKAGIDLIPVLSELVANVGEGELLKFGFTQESIDNAKQANKEIAEFDRMWEDLKRAAETKIVATVKFVEQHVVEPINKYGTPLMAVPMAGAMLQGAGQVISPFTGVPNVAALPGFAAPTPTADLSGAQNPIIKAQKDAAAQLSAYDNSKPGLEALKSAAEKTEKADLKTYQDLVAQGTKANVKELA